MKKADHESGVDPFSENAFRAPARALSASGSLSQFGTTFFRPGFRWGAGRTAQAGCFAPHFAQNVAVEASWVPQLGQNFVPVWTVGAKVTGAWLI